MLAWTGRSSDLLVAICCAALGTPARISEASVDFTFAGGAGTTAQTMVSLGLPNTADMTRKCSASVAHMDVTAVAEQMYAPTWYR